MKKENKLIIEYNDKKYSFSTRAIILFPIGTILLAIVMIHFFELRLNNWLHEIVAKQVTFLMNLFFNLNAEAIYIFDQQIWLIRIPDSITVYIISGCTGTPAMSILTSFVICTPHSQDLETNKDILWRKTVDIILTVIFIYLFNLFRMVIINYLYHLGADWYLIHDSFANLSAVVAAHIFIFWFCNKFIPEWYISIYYSAKSLYLKIREKRKR